MAVSRRRARRKLPVAEPSGRSRGSGALNEAVEPCAAGDAAVRLPGGRGPQPQSGRGRGNENYKVGLRWLAQAWEGAIPYRIGIIDLYYTINLYAIV